MNYIFYKADIEYWLEFKRIRLTESTPSPILGDVTQFHNELIRGSLDYLKNEKRIELPEYTDISFIERFRKSFNKTDIPMGVTWAAEDSYLFLEILDDAIEKKDDETIDYLKSYFDTHTLKLNFEYRDQAMNALISIKLYQYTNEAKYKDYAVNMYKWLLSQDSESGIIYIPGMCYSIVDVLGMIVPFLTTYAKAFNCPEAYDKALQQIEIYSKYGCDKENGIPAFAYTIRDPIIKIGPSNWGRGISWFVLGVSCVNLSDLSIETQKIIHLMNSTLSSIWTKYHHFDRFVLENNQRDLTADLPIIWYLNMCGSITLSKKDILYYSQFMHDGVMYNCSNGNSGAIKFGVPHGPNPLAQGLMLRLTKEAKSWR